MRMHRPAVRSLLVVGLLPNLLLGLAAASHGTRALVHLEYVALAALQPLISRTLLAVLLALMLFMDAVFSFAPVFNFGPGEIVAAVEQLRHFRGRALLFAAVILGGIVAFAWVIAIVAGRRAADAPASDARAVRRGTAVAAAIAALLVLGADVANGSNPVMWRATTLVPADVATSILGQYARGLGDPPDAGERVPAATDGVRAAIAGDSVLPRRIVLVIVESMGMPRGADLDDAFAPLGSPAVRARYDVRTGTVPFTGATTTGEFRELCGVRLSHVSMARHEIPECLPAALRVAGFRTVAMHAYDSALFDRVAWYPRLGFDDIRFADALRQRGATVECGIMFHGPCDEGVLPLLRAELTRDPVQPAFVYWLTLTSHFPLNPRARPSRPACDALGAAGRNDDACALWTAVWPVLEGVAAIAADPGVPPAWYIIVGDHAPPQVIRGGDGDAATPFQRDRLRFSSDEVPFVELRPRRGSAVRP